jgi:DNA topoisomerase-1
LEEGVVSKGGVPLPDREFAELWIIEAPGKAKLLEEILSELGLDAKVQATKGHFLAMPGKLTPLGIDARLHEFMREPTDEALYQRIRDMAKMAGKVVVATDADSEGDVIGWDAAEAVSDIHPCPVRVRLKGMDTDSIMEAIGEATPVRKEDAIAGRTRAIVDRMIGGVFSRDGVAVGRVGTAMLGVIQRDKPSVLRLRLAAPAKDGGRPWLAECDVKAPLTPAVADKLSALALPALDMAGSSAFTAKPAHMGEIMVRAADHLDMSPVETAKSMQRTYEAGRLSYPRAGSKGMSRSAARKLRKVLEAAGYKYDDAKVAAKDEHEVHDSPYPIGKVDVTLDPKRLGSDEGVRTMVARDLVRCGQTHTVQKAATARLEAFLIQQGVPPAAARHVAGLDWRREQGPRYPGQENWAKSEVVRRRPDAALLEAVMAAGLGRPSTWANHVSGFLSRGLVDDNLNLTDKGRAWVAASPPELVDPRVSAAIERACEHVNPALFSDPDREPWEVLAEKIIRALPSAIQKPLMDAAAAEPPRPRRDFRHLAEPGLDFEALSAPQPSYGYVPEGD